MTDPPPLADADLIAYLDGELDEAAARAVEARLAADPLARKTADAFRRSFALLDALPKPEPADDFTRRTVTRIEVPGGSTVSLPAPAGRRWPTVLAVLVAGLLVGVGLRLVGRGGTETPGMADLAVIEALPLYAGADDLPFVRRLAETGLFAPDPAAKPFDPADPSPEARERLTAAFQQLPPRRRQQVRTLHADLTALPADERDKLGRTLERYAGWLDRLPAADRGAVLAVATPDARLTAVRDAVLTARREALPAGTRTRLAGLSTDERLRTLAELQEADRTADADWSRAAGHWRAVATPGTKPYPFDLPDGLGRVDEFVRAVLRVEPGLKQPDDGRLTAAEIFDLRQRRDAATRDGHWFLYGLGVWRLADRHPSLPKPRVRPPVVRPADLAELKLLPRQVAQIDKLPTGRWPEFARAAVRELTGKRPLALTATDAFGPCRPGEYPEPVDAVLKELIPLLTDAERKRLKAAEGKWPDHPELLVRFARERDRELPGVSLPGSPARWQAAYSVGR